MGGTVSFQQSAVGSKGTGGTTFTIPLNSTAQDMIVIAIAYLTGGPSVASIQDVNNPASAYNKAGGITSGGGSPVTIELWSSISNYPPSTGGTITVTLSGSGTACVGVAGSYRTVGTQPENANNSANPTSSTTVSIANQQLTPGGWWIGGFAVGITTAFVSVSGFLRNQITANGCSVALADSGGQPPSTLVGISETITTSSSCGSFFELDPALDAPSVNRFRPSFGSGRSAFFSNTT
jgi:hypothetical protein